MPEINIVYDIASRTFTATDEMANEVNFQTMPDGIEREQKKAVSIGLRPMQALLMALGSCSGIDIVSILEKQKQEFTLFRLIINSEREQDIIPSLWKNAQITFILEGNLDEDKVKRAAALSIDKYCSVAETLRRAGCQVSYTVKLN